MGEFVGTPTLFKLAWRRDRWIILATALAMGATSYSTMKATLDLYSNGLSAKDAAVFINNPSILAVYGPLPSLTVEAVGVLKTVTMCALAAAFLGFVLVRRHTRTDEELGRQELLSSGVVGRRAPLAAAVLIATLAVVASAVLCALGLAATKVSLAGSLALAVTVLIAGLVTIGLAAVAVQLTSTTRAAGGYAAAAIGVAYALRAVGDGTGHAWLTWTSYLGWAQQVSPFGANRFWLLLPALAATVVLLWVADRLLHLRDLGAGLRAARPGPAYSTISGPFGLARRLNISAVRGWLAGYVLLGLLVGSLVKSVDSLVSDPKMEDMLRRMSGGKGTLVDLFVGTELRFMALGLAAYGISTVLRARGEETSGRAELVLSTPVSRLAWLGSDVAVALINSAFLMLALVCAAVLTSGGLLSFSALLAAGAALLPAIWCCIAAAAVVVAALPRWSNAAWAMLVVFLLLAEFGAMLKLPSWVIGLTPFGHIGSLPGGSFDTVGALCVAAVTLGLLGLAALGIRRRDIPS